MAEPKTKPNPASVEDFVKAVSDPTRREDCLALIALMKEATRCEPKMWGESIVGFGDHHYRYESGREGDMFLVGFSPRKGAITVYLCGGIERFRALLDRLGKCKTGKGCLYLKRLADVDQSVLATLLEKAAETPLDPAG